MNTQFDYSKRDIQEEERDLEKRLWQDMQVANEYDGTQVTRVVLADDHPDIRAGIRTMLKRTPDIEVIGEASNGVEAIELVETLKPDVLILDVEMPVMTGSKVAERLKKTGSSVRILVLSAYNDQQYILEMLENGASGYLIKEEVPDILITAIRNVAHGAQGWVSRSVANRLDELQRVNKIDQPTLTYRELDIISMVVKQKTNAEIANELQMSEALVERHIEILMTKLKVSSRTDLILRAEYLGLVNT